MRYIITGIGYNKRLFKPLLWDWPWDMLFKKFKFRNKLLASFLAVFLPLILIGSTVAYLQTKKILETSIENELNQTTTSLVNLIQISAAISIQNRLRAIAEKNYDIAEYYYSKHRSGLLTREQAIRTIEEIFLNQPIGISGYIYCLNSKGLVIIHPNDKVKETNVSNFDFVKKQLETKEGYLEYDWKNPGEAHEQSKALYMVYFKPLDWIISVSSYRGEFQHLVDIKDFREEILSFKSGETGYGFVMDETGKALIHPSLQGTNLLKHSDNAKQILGQIIDQKNGKLRYIWQNPNEPHPRKKIVLFKYLPEFNWIIASTSYEDEVYSPLQTFRTFIMAVLAIMLFFGVILTFFISRSVTKPLDKLIQKLEAGSQGDFSGRMEYDSPDELGKVSSHFNAFMDRLEDYHEKLKAEIQKTHKTQAALVENELKLRGLFNQSFQYTGILSPSGILEEVNQSALDFAGCTESDVLYKPFWETLWWRHDPNRQKEIKNAIQRAMKGELVRLETTNTNQSGDIKDVDVSIKPIFNTAKQVEFIIVEGRDITNLKQAEFEKRYMAVQLEKSQKMEAMGTLAGGIAHDFNNILSSIFGYTQLAKMTLDTPEKTKKYIDQIVKGAQRAAGLVQQILTFSRQAEFKKHPLKIHLVIKETLKLLRSSIPTTIDIQVNILSESMVMADPTQMHQVIMNLCTNAYHSMLETGGNLMVQLQEIGMAERDDQPVRLPKSCPYLKMTVKDTGHGMDQDTLKKAFDPYFTTKEVGRGTGFGLALVRAIIEEHEGVIHVESQPGIGSTFSLYLPVVEKEPATQQRVNIMGDPRGGKETIMVVDDDEDIRMLTTDLLERSGYTAHSFKNGEEALVHFKLNPDQFDLIITDMTMPRMTGYTLAKKILQTRKEMPIILCTGYSETISKTRALEMGIRRYLEKPLQNKELLFNIREVLDAD
jgi:two-component system cell cycle sensor histidine kinase/response regulator CckA